MERSESAPLIRQLAVNAFILNWKWLRAYLFPPFALIQGCLTMRCDEDGLRESQATVRAYQSAWHCWRNWCLQRQSNPLYATIAVVLEYSTFLFEKGLSYRTIGIHRSMLSSTLGEVEGFRIGLHRLVSRLLRAVYSLRPPRPKYRYLWNVASVLCRLKGWGRVEELSFNKLTRRTCLLLVLATSCRVSELASIARKDLLCNESQMSISLRTPRKSQRGSALKRLIILSA